MTDTDWMDEALNEGGLLNEVASLLIERHDKYGAGNIARHGLPGIRVRLDDKLARLANGSDDYLDESYRDAWLDVVGYGLIALMWLDGKWPGGPVKAAQTSLTGASATGDPATAEWADALRVGPTWGCGKAGCVCGNGLGGRPVG